MNQLHRPRRYYQPVSPFWWLRRRSYLIFALRELSCLFVAWFVVYLLLLVSAVNAGEDRYRQFLTASANPWMLLLNVIALLFAVLHAIAWFNQTPQAIVVRIHGQRVPRKGIVTFMYLLDHVISGGSLDNRGPMMIKISPQPFLWLLFSAGGLVTALLTPIFFLLFGIIFPLGLVAPPDHERLLAVLHYPLIRVVLLGVCLFALLHCAHRFHYILRDGLRLKHPNQVINVTCYTGAIIGSIMAGYILLHT